MELLDIEAMHGPLPPHDSMVFPAASLPPRPKYGYPVVAARRSAKATASTHTIPLGCLAIHLATCLTT